MIEASLQGNPADASTKSEEDPNDFGIFYDSRDAFIDVQPWNDI
jgi:hypothetical protein